MSKAYRWFGMTATEEKIQGEAHTAEDAQVRAQAAGCVPGNFHVEVNPEFGIDDDLTAHAPEVVGQTASDTLKDQDDKRVLAEANATMFHQLDAAKNQIIDLEAKVTSMLNLGAAMDALENKCKDLQALLVAWNSEQQAKQDIGGPAYVEPAFMELIRSLI